MQCVLPGLSMQETYGFVAAHVGARSLYLQKCLRELQDANIVNQYLRAVGMGAEVTLFC